MSVKKKTTLQKASKSEDVFEDIRPKATSRVREKTVVKKIPTLEEQKKLVDEPYKAEQLDRLKVIPVETSAFVFAPDPIKTETKKYECSCCGVAQGYDDFFPSYSLLNKHKAMMTVCKSCVDGLWKAYLLRYSGEISKTLYYFCMLLDIPYFQNILEEAKKLDEGVGFFKKYMTKILSYNRQNNTCTFLDGQLLYDGSNQVNPAFFDYDEDEVSYIPNAHDIRAWGRIAPQDIYFLKIQYEDWCSRYEVKDKGMEEVVKQICHKQLRIFRMNEQDANTSRELKDLQDLMASASLKPVQNKNIATEENTLGNWIKRFENERPVPAPDPEFADVDGIWKKIRIWFLGHFSKIYNYENEYSREYEQEMSKYRVDTKEKYETKWATHQMGKELFKDD